jgi:hypothetical protein
MTYERPTVSQASKYIRDLVERVAATFAQAFLAALVAANWFDIAHIRDLSVLQTAGVAGIASVLALIKGLIAARLARKDTASLAPGV